MKLYLGCALPPFHPQHIKLMGDVNSWTWVDLYVDHSNVKKWDATNLPVDDNSCEAIYASHLLEHIEHTRVQDVVNHWYSKLQKDGELLINVPDLEWCAKRIGDYAQGELLEGYYTSWVGDRGILSILYGSQSHVGEYHKSGFVLPFVQQLFINAGFKTIELTQTEDAHDMGVIIGKAKK